MIAADWAFLGIIVAGLALGALFGFGGVFKFFTSGIFGIIISVIVCFLIGFSLKGPFDPLLIKISESISANENWFCQFLAKLNIEVILYYVIMFVIVWLLRFLIVRVVRQISKSENKVIKVLNRVLGALLFLAILLLLGFLIIKLIGWVGGSTADNVYKYLNSGLLGLGNLYRFINPLEVPAESVLRLFIV